MKRIYFINYQDLLEKYGNLDISCKAKMAMTVTCMQQDYDWDIWNKEYMERNTNTFLQIKWVYD